MLKVCKLELLTWTRRRILLCHPLSLAGARGYSVLHIPQAIGGPMSPWLTFLIHTDSLYAFTSFFETCHVLNRTWEKLRCISRLHLLCVSGSKSSGLCEYRVVRATFQNLLLACVPCLCAVKPLQNGAITQRKSRKWQSVWLGHQETAQRARKMREKSKLTCIRSELTPAVLRFGFSTDHKKKKMNM